MILNLALIAFISVFVSSLILALLRIFAKKNKPRDSIEDFLLGGKNLGKLSIVNLLLSSSFGLNALFYAAWLGYIVGIWGFVIQAAWALSFIFLTPFSDRVRSGNSLHDFLGKKFGFATKIVAAICSLVGIMYLMGWEIGIGEATITALLASSNDLPPERITSAASLLIIGIVSGTLLFTVLGGLKGNASADKLLNLLKIIVIGFLSYLLLQRFFSLENVSFVNAMFPSYETLQEKLGVWGLITSIIFNLTWQFVDNSSWQSIIAGGETNKKETAWNLKMSGLTIFLTVGILGTLIGIALANIPDITPDNILTQAVQILPEYKTLMTLGMFILITACVMSLLDGLFLASALTLVIDIFQSRKNSIWTQDDYNPGKKLIIVRLLLILIAAMAMWGVKFILYITGANLFDFVFIIIISQLALFGPIIIGLATDRTSKYSMWLPIVIALITGFGLIIVGTKYELKYLIDGAGTFTILASLISALLVTTNQTDKI